MARPAPDPVPDYNAKAPVLDDLLAGLETAPRERANEFLGQSTKRKAVLQQALHPNVEVTHADEPMSQRDMIRALQREQEMMREYQHRERQMEIRRSPFYMGQTLGSSTGTSLTAPPPEDDIPF